MQTVELDEYSLDIHRHVHLAISEPDDWLETISAEVTRLDPESSDPREEKVGSAGFYYANWDRFGRQSEGLTAFDVFDAHSEELREIYAAIYRGPNARPRSFWSHARTRDVLVLDRIRIDPRFRGMGLGTRVMECLADVLGRQVGIVVVKPFPIELKEMYPDQDLSTLPRFGRELKRVQSFYRRVGFSRAPTSEVFYLIPPASILPTNRTAGLG